MAYVLIVLFSFILPNYQSKKIYMNRIFKWFKKDFGNLKNMFANT